MPDRPAFHHLCLACRREYLERLPLLCCRYCLSPRLRVQPLRQLHAADPTVRTSDVGASAAGLERADHRPPTY